MTVKTASVLLAHGSSDKRWQAPFASLAETVDQLSGAENRIELAYMELCEPSLESVCHKLALDGVKHIDIYPLFFAAGRHLRKDVPAQLERLQQELSLTTSLHEPVGQAEAVKRAIAEVILEKL